jgi:hypothetical protein
MSRAAKGWQVPRSKDTKPIKIETKIIRRKSCPFKDNQVDNASVGFMAFAFNDFNHFGARG